MALPSGAVFSACSVCGSSVSYGEAVFPVPRGTWNSTCRTTTRVLCPCPLFICAGTTSPGLRGLGQAVFTCGVYSPLHVAGRGTRLGSFIPGHSSTHPVPMSDLNKPIGNRHVGIPVSMAWGPPSVSQTPSGLAKSQCPVLRGKGAVSFAGRERGMRRLSPKLSRVIIRRCFRRRTLAQCSWDGS